MSDVASLETWVDDQAAVPGRSLMVVVGSALAASATYQHLLKLLTGRVRRARTLERLITLSNSTCLVVVSDANDPEQQVLGRTIHAAYGLDQTYGWLREAIERRVAVSAL